LSGCSKRRNKPVPSCKRNIRMRRIKLIGGLTGRTQTLRKGKSFGGRKRIFYSNNIGGQIREVAERGLEKRGELWKDDNVQTQTLKHGEVKERDFFMRGVWWVAMHIWGSVSQTFVIGKWTAKGMCVEGGRGKNEKKGVCPKRLVSSRRGETKISGCVGGKYTGPSKNACREERVGGGKRGKKGVEKVNDRNPDFSERPPGRVGSWGRNPHSKTGRRRRHGFEKSTGRKEKKKTVRTWGLDKRASWFSLHRGKKPLKGKNLEKASKINRIACTISRKR